MNRREAREYVLQRLFQSEFGDNSLPLPEGVMPAARGADDQTGFAEEIISGTISHMEELDRIIQAAAENWDLGRMAAVDRNILRFAAYELLFRQDIPSAVTINEALEIAKKFSSFESVPFINGLLDKIARDSGKV